MVSGADAKTGLLKLPGVLWHMVLIHLPAADVVACACVSRGALAHVRAIDAALSRALVARDRACFGPIAVRHSSFISARYVFLVTCAE
jgi:hypothetical protein